MTVIITISFILHIITMMIIYHLVKQLRGLKGTSTKEIQAVFDVYLQEIKEENNRLQQEINKNTLKATKQNQYQHPNTNVSRQDIPVTKATYRPPQQLETANDLLETSLQSQMLQLYDNGLSTEDIAKKLNCGKTEVELSIKMNYK